MYEHVEAIVVQGYQVASGRSLKDQRFPSGTIQLQAPIFKERGLDFNEYFNGDYFSGTLNLSLGDKKVTVKCPEYNFRNVKWTDQLPAENFYLSKASIFINGESYCALIYIPDPNTKVDHFSSDSIIEVIAERILGIQYGDILTLCYNPNEISIS